VNDSPPFVPFRHGPRSHLDPFRPHAWFVERERSASGEVVSVATVFLTNRQCPWRCLYCDLWKNALMETVPPGAIPAQIDFALAQFAAESCSQIKLYNAGSFFDPKAVPPEDFSAIAERVRGFERVIVECHPALVGKSALRFRDLLAQSSIAPQLEVAMGLEIADDAILARLNKRMTLAGFRRAAEFLLNHGIAVRVFVIVKPPFVRTEADALEFARRSIDFAFDCGAGVVSLIPARFGAEELGTLAQTGDFAPPKLETLEAALDYGVGLSRGRVFADLWDAEKLGGCGQCRIQRVARLRAINRRQQVETEVECLCQRVLGVPPGQSATEPGFEPQSRASAHQDSGGLL
jgi:radical SAM enzyme (TIGR01210 family)